MSQARHMKDIQLENLWKLIKSKRKTLGLRQQDVAKKAGICVQQYSRIERGEFIPSLRTFFKLIDVLNIELPALRIKNETISPTTFEIISLLENFTIKQQQAVLSFLRTMIN